MDPHGSRAPTELELLKMRMNKTTDESLESTRRMVGLCNESQTVGSATMAQLGEQREQLQRVEGNLNYMHEDLKQAQTNLKKLDNWYSLRPKHKKNKGRRVEVPEYQERYTTPPSDRHPNLKQQPKPQPVIPGQGQFIPRILNDAREDEMEDNFQQISQMMGGLKDLATDMNQELRSQNKMLERIDGQVNRNQILLNSAQRQAEQLVGRPTKTPSVIPSKNTMRLNAAKYMME